MTATAATGAGTGNTRAGFAALLGAPNAGKSTLLNRMAGAKLSIVSPKAQTTRARVLGIVMRNGAGGDATVRAQIVLVDTPGIFKPKRGLDRAMVAAAWTGATDADLVCLLVDARSGLDDGVDAILAGLAERAPRRLWLVLNKVDLVAPSRLLPLTDALRKRAPFGEILYVSALTGDGVDTLLDQLAGAMPAGPLLYPEDELTDLPDRLLAAELVREQVFLQLHEEVPYGATVETESWTERQDGSVRVDVTIYVARPGHKAIVIGDGGSRIREIGKRARMQLTTLIGRPCHLFLNVKERAGWDEEAARIRAIGLEIPKG